MGARIHILLIQALAEPAFAILQACQNPRGSSRTQALRALLEACLDHAKPRAVS